MVTRKSQKKRTGYFILYFYLVLILLLLLTVATYTWFSISATPRVSDLSVHVTTLQGLELAPSYDAEEWKLQLDFVDLVDQTAPLRPVTWSDENQQFFAACYGFDGRLLDVWEPLTDERNANKDTLDGYYTKITVYARTGQNVTATLSPAVEVDEGLQGAGTYVIGTPIWNEETIRHDNGGAGAECAVRVGFRITKLKPDGTPTGEPSVFTVYEPNADQHLERPKQTVPTATGETVPETEPEPDPTGQYIATPSIDGTEHLVSEDRLIIQSASTWTEAYPVEREVLIHELGEFTTETELFSLTPDEIACIEIYIWLEGQDVDCTNQINQAQILTNIQFGSNADGQSGMVPIEDE